MKNKKLILVFVVLLVIASIYFGVLGKPDQVIAPTPTPLVSTSPSSTPISGTLFESSELGFSFRYPETVSVVPQNFMDTTDHKTLISLADSDKTHTIRVSVLMDPKTGKPLSTDLANYEKVLINDVIYDGSGDHPKAFSAFQLRKIGDARFAYIQTGSFEGVLSLSYYAIVPGGIVRFSLVSRGVDWTNPKFDAEQDAGHLALKRILATLKVGGYSSLTTPYSDPLGIYTVSVPTGWKINTKFTYDAIGPDKKIPGVSFTIPDVFTSGKNLSSDSYLSIEKNPYANLCTADEFVSTGVTTPSAKNVVIGGITWNVGESADTAAGNLYNEIVYATKHGNDCYGIRLFLHSSNIDNYDAGAKQEFDKSLFTSIQDKVVASFQFLK